MVDNDTNSLHTTSATPQGAMAALTINDIEAEATGSRSFQRVKAMLHTVADASPHHSKNGVR